jgi:hypothetical protein
VTADLDPLLAGAAGTRVDWEHVPLAVRRSIEDHLGLGVVAAQSQQRGFSPALAARLRLSDGSSVFAKAIGPDDQTGAPGGQGFYRREAEVSSQLPGTVPRPALMDNWEVGGWVVLVFENIEGANPVLPWQRSQLDRVLAAMEATARALTPSPLPAPLASTPGGTTHWRDLMAEPDRLGWLTGHVPWVGEHVQQLAELEASSDEAYAGGTLLHFDVRADNILLTDGDVYLVDWPHVRIGAPWVDLVYFLPSVAMQGGPSPQELFWRHPLSEEAATEDVVRVLAAFAGFMLDGATRPPPPGLPGLRRFQLAQGLEALRWLRLLPA